MSNPFEDPLWSKCYRDLHHDRTRTGAPPTRPEVDAARAILAERVESGLEPLIYIVHGVGTEDGTFPETPAHGVRFLIYAGTDATDAWDAMVDRTRTYGITCIEIAINLGKAGNLTNCELSLVGPHPYKGQADGCQSWAGPKNREFYPWKEYIV